MNYSHLIILCLSYLYLVAEGQSQTVQSNTSPQVSDAESQAEIYYGDTTGLFAPIAMNAYADTLSNEARLRLERIVRYLQQYQVCEVEVNAHVFVGTCPEENCRYTEKLYRVFAEYLIAKGISVYPFSDSWFFRDYYQTHNGQLKSVSQAQVKIVIRELRKLGDSSRLIKTIPRLEVSCRPPILDLIQFKHNSTELLKESEDAYIQARIGIICYLLFHWHRDKTLVLVIGGHSDSTENKIEWKTLARWRAEKVRDAIVAYCPSLAEYSVVKVLPMERNYGSKPEYNRYVECFIESRGKNKRRK